MFLITYVIKKNSGIDETFTIIIDEDPLIWWKRQAWNGYILLIWDRR